MFADCLQDVSCCVVSDVVIVGEIANFVAYAFAPAVLVTPLGALSIIVRYFIILLHLSLLVIVKIFFWICHELVCLLLLMFKMILQQSAILAQLILNEKLHKLGILGCVMCIAGSIIIVIHAPQERPISSVQEIWSMATQPGEKILACTVLGDGSCRKTGEFLLN